LEGGVLKEGRGERGEGRGESLQVIKEKARKGIQTQSSSVPWMCIVPAFDTGMLEYSVVLAYSSTIGTRTLEKLYL
jgi:hypothetical protein